MRMEYRQPETLILESVADAPSASFGFRHWQLKSIMINSYLGNMLVDNWMIVSK